MRIQCFNTMVNLLSKHLLHFSVLLYEYSLVYLVYDGHCTGEHIVENPFSTVCSLTHLDHDVRCISEHTALSLLSRVSSIILVHIKLPIFNHILRNILGTPHKILQFTNRYVGLRISNRPINKAANNEVYIKQSSAGGILKAVVLYSSSTYYEDVQIAQH
jgi:hypothetical protein